MKVVSRHVLDQIKQEALNTIKESKCRILICAGTGCLAGGSGLIYEKMLELAKDDNVEVEFGKDIACKGIHVKKSGCHGFCEMGPLMRIEPLGILYIKVKLSDCERIYEETIKKGIILEDLLYKQDGVVFAKQEEIPFYKRQTRLVLKNCGQIDAEHIEEAIAHDGYQALAKALFDMKPQDVIQVISDSNLRG